MLISTERIKSEQCVPIVWADFQLAVAIQVEPDHSTLLSPVVDTGQDNTRKPITEEDY